MAGFTTLYSGSSGNCAVVEENGAYLLVDMGKSCRQTLAALKQVGLEPDGLQGILVTHEHSDHISGLSVFLKKYPVPVYAYGESLHFLRRQGIVPETVPCIDVRNKSLHVGDFWVESFETSHDSLACCGYRIVTHTQKTVALATDLGYVSPEVLANLYCADVVALESNYDPYLLMSGKYPAALKYRILSNSGHLSNEDCAKTVVKLMENGCEKIVLCHLSKENNEPELALGSVHLELQNRGLSVPEQTVLRAASRFEPDEWLTI